MRRRLVRSTLFWMLVGIGIVVGLQCLWLVVGPPIRHWQVEKAIARFEAKPSQARADELVGLICNHAADAEQGRRALRLLLQPGIAARRTYAVGQPVRVNLERAFELGFRNVLWLDGTISVDGQPVLRDHGAPRQFRSASKNLHVPRAYPQAGTYPVEIRFQYAVGIERASRLWSLFAGLSRRFGIVTGAGWQPARTYDCDFTVRTEVVIAAPEKAETVELVSNPDLDRAVRRAFLMDGPGANSASSMSAPGPGITPMASYIHYQKLPVAVSFQCVRRLPDGREVPFPGWYPEQFRAPAGSSGSFFVDLQVIRLRAGESFGTIVLKPDRELAYKDPTIKAIWNGTLEFPVESMVAPQPGTAQQENSGGK